MSINEQIDKIYFNVNLNVWLDTRQIDRMMDRPRQINRAIDGQVNRDNK